MNQQITWLWTLLTWTLKKLMHENQLWGNEETLDPIHGSKGTSSQPKTQRFTLPVGPGRQITLTSLHFTDTALQRFFTCRHGELQTCGQRVTEPTRYSSHPPYI